MEEVWKAVTGYEGLYEVSSFGRVASLNYLHTGKRGILKPRPSKNGYYFVQIFKNKVGRMIPIHRLVALMFVDKPEGFDIINHKDENKHNNRADNLEWCTQSYNVIYSLKKRADNPNPRDRRSGIPYKHKFQVDQYDLNENKIKTWNSISEISKLKKWNATSILECCKGKRKTAYGFKWHSVTENNCGDAV